MTFRSLAVAALLALTPLPARALQPVDDFDVGDFDFYAADGALWEQVHVPNYLSHAIWMERSVLLNPVGGPIRARTQAGPSTHDRALYVNGETSTSSCIVGWDWGVAYDLTLGGTLDRVELDVMAAAPGTRIDLRLQDGTDLFGWTKYASGGPETIVWELDQLTGSTVQPEAATGMGLQIWASSAATIVSDFRFHRSGAGAVNFVPVFVATQVPPLPSPPLAWQVRDLFSSPLYQAEIVIADADAGYTPVVLGQWQQWQAQGGWLGAADFRWDPSSPWADTQLALSFRFQDIGSMSAVAYPPDPVLTAEGVLLEFPVRVRQDGQVIGTALQRYQFDVPLNQGLQFAEVTGPRSGPLTDWTQEFAVSFRLVRTGDFSHNFPFLGITSLTDWAPGLLTAAPADEPSADDLLRLHAEPAVTRAGTRVLASRPFAAGATLTVHDVTGRRVADLPLSAGAASASWDGRDAAGRPTASGVYFLRLTDARGTASARVLRLR